MQNEWYGNPRYVVLSRFQIRCYRVATFPNLAVLPKMVLKSRQWKSQSCPIWMVWLLPDIKFWGESEYQGFMSWFLLCIPLYPKWCGRHQDGIRWPSLIGLVQIASRLFFQEDSESEEGNCYLSKNYFIYVYICLY